MKNINSFQPQDWAEYAINLAKQKYGQTLDYSENSLESLDSLIGMAHEYFKRSPKDSNKFNDNFEKTILMWGSFLGELIRGNCGGNWIVEKSGIFLSIDNFTVNSFEQVRAQIVNGSLYSQNADIYFRSILQHHLIYESTKSVIEINEVILGALNDNSSGFPQVNGWIVAIKKVLNLALQFPKVQFPNNDMDMNVMLTYTEKLRDRFMEMLIVGENTLETLDEEFSDTIKKEFQIWRQRQEIYPLLVKIHEAYQKYYQKQHKLLQQWTELRNAASDITTYKTDEILKSGRFTAEERKAEYRRRGKSPSGIIDGVYNDMNLEDGKPYNDTNRDWEADA